MHFTRGGLTLHSAEQALQVAVVLGCLLLAVLPRGRNNGRGGAGRSRRAIATQVVSSYWFYPYISWWLPLALFATPVLVATVAGTAQPALNRNVSIEHADRTRS